MSRRLSLIPAPSQSSNEQTLEKLALKVSELTNVVHKLFKAKHKSELEIEYLKGEFRHHLQGVENVYKNKIDSLNKLLTVADNSKNNKKTLTGENSKLNSELQSLQQKYKDTVTLMKLKDESLDQYRSENQTMIHTIADLKKLIKENSNRNMLEEIEVLKIEITDQDLKHQQIIKEYQEESESQKKEKMLHEESFCIKEKGFVEEIENLKTNIKKLKHIIQDNNKLLESADNLKKKALADKKLKEIEIQRLLKQLHESKQALAAKPLQDQPQHDTTLVKFKDEEIYYLRQEVQRYRLELLNREKNFNYAFSNNPVIIKDAWSCPVMTIDLTGQKLRSYTPQLPFLPVTPRVGTNNKKFRLLHG